MAKPTREDQIKFMTFFLETIKFPEITTKIKEISELSSSEIEKILSSILPDLNEMGLDDGFLKREMETRGLPNYNLFKMLNKKYVNKLLKSGTISDGDEYLIIREAMSANLISKNKIKEANDMLLSYNSC